MGVPLAAVHAEMKKRDLDPSLLELDAAHPLPLHLQVHPVMLEFMRCHCHKNYVNKASKFREN